MAKGKIGALMGNIKSADDIINLCTKLCLIAIIATASYMSLSADYIWAELDSYSLPVISLQYRRSIVMSPEDIARAKADFPVLYNNVNGYDDLRSAKLRILSDDKWLSYYFPIYSLLCIPIKLVLQFFHLPQARTFPMTNGLLVILSFLIVYKKLNVKPSIKLALVLLLFVSPIMGHIPLISAEAMLFSLNVIALVYFYNKSYKRAAFVISLAGMANPTIMVVGMMMIVNYLVDVAKEEGLSASLTEIKNKLKKIIAFGVCFTPCLVPFLLDDLLGMKGFLDGGGATTVDLWKRFSSYLFDLNLGFAAFTPFLVILTPIIFAVNIYKKNYRSHLFLLAFLGVILAYSLMLHINCGMWSVARYVVWTHPLLVFYIALYGGRHVKNIATLSISSICFIGAMLLMSWTSTQKGFPYYYWHSYYMNNFASFALDKFPALYNPYEATFNCRVNHIDGAYLFQGMDTCIYYEDSRTQEVRKILLYGNDESKKHALNQLERFKVKGNINPLRIKINNIANDKKFHYINIPPSSECQLTPLIREIFLSSFASQFEQTSKNEYFISDGRAGFLMYGPYQRLRKGAYTFEIQYELMGSSSEGQIADVDVCVNTGSVTLTKMSVSASDFKDNTLHLTMPLTLERDAGDLEIRTFVHEGAILKIKQVRIVD